MTSEVKTRTGWIYGLTAGWLVLGILPVALSVMTDAGIPTGNVLVLHAVGIILAISAFILGRKAATSTIRWVSRVPILLEVLVVVVILAAGGLWTFKPQDISSAVVSVDPGIDSMDNVSPQVLEELQRKWQSMVVDNLKAAEVVQGRSCDVILSRTDGIKVSRRRDKEACVVEAVFFPGGAVYSVSVISEGLDPAFTSSVAGAVGKFAEERRMIPKNDVVMFEVRAD